MKREIFKEILSNLHFSNNGELLPRDNPHHDRELKLRWFINHLNERPKKGKSVD